MSAHYDQDLSWTRRVDVPVIVYSKTDPRYDRVPGNRGREVPCYLKFIIDHYDGLPQKMVFVHGHRESYHQLAPIEVLLRWLNWDQRYFNINRWAYQCVQWTTDKPDRRYAWLRDNWDDIFVPYLDLPRRLLFFGAAQFLVDRDCVRQYPRVFWANSYEWVQRTPIDSFVSSRIFEYTWHYLLTRKRIEPFPRPSGCSDRKHHR